MKKFAKLLLVLLLFLLVGMMIVVGWVLVFPFISAYLLKSLWDWSYYEEKIQKVIDFVPEIVLDITGLIEENDEEKD